MSKTLRSESAAHGQLAARAAQHAATREDWRRVLERRDARRAAVRNVRPVRRAQSGFAVLPMLQMIVSAALAFFIVRG